MKKVFIGVGIGCGVLILGVLAFVAIGGYMLKRTVGDKLGDMAATGQKMEAQKKAFADLDSRFPFDAPPKGQPLALTDERLGVYLAIREDTMPVYTKFEAEGKAFEAKYKNAGQVKSLGGVMEGTKMITDMMAEMRSEYAKALEARKMSPREFGAITGAVYGAAAGASMSASRTQIAAQLKNIDAQEKGADPQMKAALEQQRTAMKSMLASLPASTSDATFQANAALVAKYQDRLNKSANGAFDAFAIGADDEFGRGLNMGMGLGPNDAHPSAE